MKRAWQAFAAYAALALVATWPLARGLVRDVAWDLGDSVLNMWVLSWDCEQLLAILRGDLSRVAHFFDGNIFYPAPLTLAYAEHLFPQAVQALPVYAVTHNPILCYNLLFLSTFALSGLGMYLFARELTGNALAAFLAGLLFAFAPYRFPQSPHLQVLSSQWMPFALYGFRRYFDRVEAGQSGWRPLLGGSLALLTQNLSCGYYLLYFSPFAAAYILWELARRHLATRARVWVQLAFAGAAVIALTAPFLIPYAQIRRAFRFERSTTEVVRYSADVYSYATATGDQPLWGHVLREMPKAEGDLFPGVVTVLLALIALLAWRPADVSAPRLAPWATRHRWILPVAVAGAALHLIVAAFTLANRRIVEDIGPLRLQITNINQLLIRGIVFAAVACAASPAIRDRLRQLWRDRGFFAVAALAAAWFSLGPIVQVYGRPADLAAPYAFLYDHVPGFEGVRVPARLAMIVTLMLAALAAYGAAVLARRRHGVVIIGALSIAFLAEAFVWPFTVNGVTPTRGFNMPEARLYKTSKAPAVYKAFAEHQGDTVLAELPLGESDFDLRAMYYSIVHWRPLLNGYSGFYPPHYGKLALAVSDVVRYPEPALRALQTGGATHVIVHEALYLGERGSQTTMALRGRGARELFRAGPDVLLALPAPR